jgi:beta-glucanase (GH16 family)
MRTSSLVSSVVAMVVVAASTRAATVTVVNNCGYTVYPGIYPPVHQNGGWSQAAGTSVAFTLNNEFTGRLWGRTGCNTATSPAQCTTGSCGGTGLQCAGTTGHPNTSLFEINVDATGTDWYNVSYVDAIDSPIGVQVSNGACRSPNTCTNAVKTSCPADLVSGSTCLSPCTRYNTDQLCCRGAFGTPQTCVTSQWPASAQTYLNNVHQFCPSQYAYAYDEANDALHTCPTGANYTVTFCPSGSVTPPRATPTPTPTTSSPSGNLALNRPALASSSESASFAANFAVDGNTGTRWSSAFSDPQWIRVDLGSTFGINRVVLRWEAAFARAYQIQTSPDGNTWTTISSTTTGDGGVDDVAVSGSGRYVRMNGTARGTAWGYSLLEMEVYGSTSPQPTPTPTPTSSSGYVEVTPPASSVTASANDGNLPGNVVDNNLSTRWSANGDGQWLQLDLGTARTIGYVRIAFYNGNVRSSRFDLQVSNGGGVWSNVLTGALSSGTSTQEQTFDFTDVSARWVRYLGHGNTTNLWNSLTEVSVFALSGVSPTAAPTPTLTPTPTPTPSGPAGWTLVWSDEFNGAGAPNSTNWSYHVGNGNSGGAFTGWGNGEWEWYRPENCTQSGGNLLIRADWLATPMSIAGRDWYQRSCRITTQGKRSWTYGRIEARAAVPHAAGSWPAFWMMGTSSGGSTSSSYTPASTYYDTMATTWASCGEIDILEKRNYENININNIFWDMRTGVFPWTAGQNANYGTSVGFADLTQFHVYAIEWDATFIRWFVDGQQTHVIDITPATLEEFHKPFYIIMNLALAGAFPQMDPNPAEFPLTMRVDYVRVYQRP